MEKTTRTFYPVWQGVQNGFCDFLNNPTLWSDEMCKATLERSGTKTHNIEDCRTIVKDYLTVLCNYIRTNGGTYY